MPYYKDLRNKVWWLDDPDDPVKWLPTGSVKISDGEAETLLPKPDPETIKAAQLQLVREVREAILNRLAGIALAASLTGDTATVEAYIQVRIGLLDITKNLTENIDTVIKQRYKELVGLCTDAMKLAFSEVDL